MPTQLQAGAGAQERGEDRRRLAGEGLLRDLQDPDVLTGELRRPAEVVGARLAAAAAAGSSRRPSPGAGGPAGAAGPRALPAGGAAAGGAGGGGGDASPGLRIRPAGAGPVSGAVTSHLIGGAGADPDRRRRGAAGRRERCDGWCGACLGRDAERCPDRRTRSRGRGYWVTYSV